MRLLFFGDIVGRTGRQALKDRIPALREEFSPDVVIANGENAAGGLGLDLKTADEIYKAGIDVITSGNHIWNKKDIELYLKSDRKILRPGNYSSGAPGRGFVKFRTENGQCLGIVNVIGRVFMADLVDCPFEYVSRVISENFSDCDAVVVDFHAEATSEKVAMGIHVDGKASLVVGTHTHVQTSDERILNNGTAVITDVGMCGSSTGVIGASSEFVLQKFLTGRPAKFALSEGGPMVNAVFVETQENSVCAKTIERIRLLL